MKTISECLNFIDTVMLNDIEKHASIGKLEQLRNCVTDIYKKELYGGNGFYHTYIISNKSHKREVFLITKVISTTNIVF